MVELEGLSMEIRRISREKRGFVFSHRVPNFFRDHYDHPIVEDGVRLADMVYLKRNL